MEVHNKFLGMAAAAALVFGAAALVPVNIGSSPAYAGDDWSPYTVDVWPGLEMRQRRKIQDYVALDSAQQKWHLCASIPHMNNEFWYAINYGLVQEARRLGVSLEMKVAGGYHELEKQIQQVRDCAEAGADAVLLAAISPDDLNHLVPELHSKGVAVVNVANDMNADDLRAKSHVSFGERGWYLAEFLVKKHPDGSEVQKVAWLVPPGEAGWVFSEHFNEEAAFGALDVVEGPENSIRGLVPDTVYAYPDLDYIIGPPETAIEAAAHLDEIGRSGEIQVMSYDLSLAVLDAIRDGTVAAVPSDSPVIQARIAVDQAVRILEGHSYHLHVGPYHFVVHSGNVNDIDFTDLLAPPDFEPVMRVD